MGKNQGKGKERGGLTQVENTGRRKILNSFCKLKFNKSWVIKVEINWTFNNCELNTKTTRKARKINKFQSIGKWKIKWIDSGLEWKTEFWRIDEKNWIECCSWVIFTSIFQNKSCFFDSLMF